MCCWPRTSSGGGTEVPAELKDVLAELRGTLSYKTYELAASVVQRLTETPRGLQGSGTAEVPGPSPGNPNVSDALRVFPQAPVSLVQNASGVSQRSNRRVHIFGASCLIRIGPACKRHSTCATAKGGGGNGHDSQTAHWWWC